MINDVVLHCTKGWTEAQVAAAEADGKTVDGCWKEDDPR